MHLSSYLAACTRGSQPDLWSSGSTGLEKGVLQYFAEVFNVSRHKEACSWEGVLLFSDDAGKLLLGGL